MNKHVETKLREDIERRVLTATVLICLALWGVSIGIGCYVEHLTGNENYGFSSGICFAGISLFLSIWFYSKYKKCLEIEQGLRG